MELCWATDIHLNCATAAKKAYFAKKVNERDAKHVLIGGDISEAHHLESHLRWLSKELNDKQIHFVLGNHDYYASGFAERWVEMKTLCTELDNLTYLDQSGPIKLTEQTALIGSGLWCDWRAGDWTRSNVWLADYQLIADFIPLWGGEGTNQATDIPNKPIGYYTAPLHKKVQQVAQLHAEQLALHLTMAIKDGYKKVVALTHVPPFWKASFHKGKISGPDWAVHFVSEVAGEMLSQVMAEHPSVDLTVLCGHTHSKGKVDILPNLHVVNGGAAYKRPVPQAPLYVE